MNVTDGAGSGTGKSAGGGVAALKAKILPTEKSKGAMAATTAAGVASSHKFASYAIAIPLVLWVAGTGLGGRFVVMFLAVALIYQLFHPVVKTTP